MISESCVDHPANSTFTLIRHWVLPFLDNNPVAAALLNVFEYWHNIRLKQAPKSARQNQIALNLGLPTDHDATLLQFHTMKELETLICGLGKRTKIEKAIALLEEKGVITRHSNPNPNYRFDRTTYYLFYPEVVNQWADQVRQQQRENTPPTTPDPVPPANFADATTEAPPAPATDAPPAPATDAPPAPPLPPKRRNPKQALSVSDYKELQATWNLYAPKAWARWADWRGMLPAKTRCLAIERAFNDYGGSFDQFLNEAWIPALQFCAGDTTNRGTWTGWANRNGLTVENFLTNGKLIQFAEKAHSSPTRDAVADMVNRLKQRQFQEAMAAQQPQTITVAAHPL